MCSAVLAAGLVGAAGQAGEWPAGVRRRARGPPAEPSNVRKQKQVARGRGSRARVEAAYAQAATKPSGAAGLSLEASPSAPTLPSLTQTSLTQSSSMGSLPRPSPPDH